MEPGSHFAVWISCWSQEVVVMPSGDASGTRKSFCCVDILLEPGSSCNAIWRCQWSQEVILLCGYPVGARK